jgi:hypothetical protein
MDGKVCTTFPAFSAVATRFRLGAAEVNVKLLASLLGTDPHKFPMHRSAFAFDEHLVLSGRVKGMEDCAADAESG